MFGYSRSGHVDFIEKNNVAFKHLFLKSWSAAYETMPYPPSSGPFAVYTVPDFFESINYVLQRVGEILRSDALQYMVQLM